MLSVKSIEKVQLQSKFDLDLQESEKISLSIYIPKSSMAYAIILL